MSSLTDKFGSMCGTLFTAKRYVCLPLISCAFPPFGHQNEKPCNWHNLPTEIKTGDSSITTAFTLTFKGFMYNMHSYFGVTMPFAVL